MLIRCKLKRNGGTKVTLDGENYHFKEDDAGHDVCDVKHQEHIDRLLNIDAYEVYGEQAQKDFEAGKKLQEAEEAEAEALRKAEEAENAAKAAESAKKSAEDEKERIARERTEADEEAKRKAQAAEEARKKAEEEKARARAANAKN